MTRIYAALAILACVGGAIAYHLVQVHSLEARVAVAQREKADAEAALQGRIRAEAQVIATAVQRARAEETLARDKLQRDYDELQRSRADDVRTLADARQRLQRLAAQKRSACPGGADVSQAPGAAGRAEGTAAELPPADRKLIDRLLQLGDAANEAVRQRDFAVRQYELNCGR